jgi:transcriptional regulator with XRE-family HTH domain
MNFEILSSQWLRALRGRRSRPGFSRFLGYQSNIAQHWETGRSWPTATTFFRICRSLRLPPEQRIRRFLQRTPRWLETADLSERASVAAFLVELQGRNPIRELASRSGYNRFSVSRWLHGTADPKLPELLALIDAASRRTLDFVAEFTPPSTLPCAVADWKQLSLLREGAYTQPLSHAVLRALELDSYAAGGHRDADYLPRTIGASADEVESALQFLLASGQVRKSRRGYRPDQVGVVDTGVDLARARQLRLAWTRRALERLEAGTSGHFGYSLFAISKLDFQRLEQLQADYVRAMQGIIANSGANECVGLYCAQLLDLARAK